MLTKGNDAKVQNEMMAQIVADTSAKWMKFTRLLPKQEIEENSQYYTYMSQRVNIEEAIQSGVLGEAKDIAPGATLQELNVRKPTSETISWYRVLPSPNMGKKPLLTRLKIIKKRSGSPGP